MKGAMAPEVYMQRLLGQPLPLFRVTALNLPIAVNATSVAVRPLRFRPADSIFAIMSNSMR
ncbi:MAG: hypothetical protein KAJ16_13645 [Calditrichia bacterium]|nr:hypothetical protein [Calditrichia bacterium]